MKLGGTGDFPRGKLNADDEGALRIGVTVKDKTVVIAFGKETAWIGMDKAGALMFAAMIKRRAEEIK
jgi:hypothetical protein